MIKSIIFAIKSPHMKLDWPTIAAILLKSPAGKDNPMNGVIMSLTNAVINFEAA